MHESKKFDLKVFYTWGENSINKFDPGFSKKIEWDIPLLDGYPFEWVKNTAKDPGTHHFAGIENPELITELNSWKPDAVLVYGWGFKSHLKVLRYFKNKIPLYFRGDSTLLDDKNGIKAILRTFFLKWVYKHIDYAFYVGTNNKNYYRKFALKEKQLVFAPHAVDNSRFGLDLNVEAQSLRNKFAINKEDILVLFAGKLEQKKAPLQLLSAFGKLNISGTHLLFVGNGSLEKEAKMMAEEYRNIHFLDFQNQSFMPIAYQAADLFCLPSVGPNETWGLAINEAMACGKAILASNKVGGAVDLIEPGLNGSIFNANELNDLSNKLEQLLLLEKNGLLKMGEYSKKTIQNWSLETQVYNIISFIENGKKTTLG
jgi:glycosyltransferase involved in cell wall biosynthesis